jgi:Sulfotransferase family
MARKKNGPDFIGVGLQKAGTRWLYQQLQAHPQFWMPPIKELHFFDRPFPHRQTMERVTAKRGTENELLFIERLRDLPRRSDHSLETYASLFELAGDRITGDITPAYGGLSDEQIAAIAKAFPTTKIVLMLRDPISRVWSNLNDMANKGKVSHDALMTADGIAECLAAVVTNPSTFPSRVYARWAKACGAERCHFFFMDDVIADGAATRDRIIRALGGEPGAGEPAIAASHNNKAGRSRVTMTADVRQVLNETFAAELKECASLFGGPAAGWASKYTAEPETPAPAPSVVTLTIAYGQSNAGAGGCGKLRKAERLFTHDAIGDPRALMFDTGLLGTEARPFDPDTVTGLSPAKENRRRGESGGVAFLRQTLIGDEAISPESATVHIYRACGRAGRVISELSAGSPPFQNLATVVDVARKLLEADGKHLVVPHILFDQGEADRRRPTSRDDYRATLAAMATDLALTITSLTGQRTPPWLLLSILADANRSPHPRPADICLAQIDSLDAGLQIAPVCCPYWFDGDHGFLEGQSVHWSPRGRALLREYGARAARIVGEAIAHNPDVRLGDPIARHVHEIDAAGQLSWHLRTTPFETSPRTDPHSIRRDGRFVSGRVFYAEGGLRLCDQLRPMARNAGFAWSGPGRIAAVTIENTATESRWRVELTEASEGILSYAITPQTSTSTTGPDSWGNIFDRCNEPSIVVPGMTLTQGMLPFSANID